MIHLLADAPANASILRDYWDTLADPGHLLTELTVEALTSLALYPVARWVWKRALRRHDQAEHQHDCALTTAEEAAVVELLRRMRDAD